MTIDLRRYEKNTGAQPFRLSLVVDHDGTVRLVSCEDCTGTPEAVADVLRKVMGDVIKVARGEHK